MLKGLTAFALISVLTAAPVAAVTYDAFSSFNGASNPAGPFSFGQTDGVTFTPFTNFETGPTAACAAGLSCLLSGTEPALGIYKNITGAAFTAFGTVDVPAGAIFFHPGPSSQAYVTFTAPTTGVYAASLFFKLLSNSTITGTTVGSGFIVGGVVVPSGSVSLDGMNPSVGPLSGPVPIAAGDSVFVTVGNAGDYTFDSTQFVLTFASDVPEPAAWALMIAGFGLVGLGMRRKAALAA